MRYVRYAFMNIEENLSKNILIIIQMIIAIVAFGVFWTEIHEYLECNTFYKQASLSQLMYIEAKGSEKQQVEKILKQNTECNYLGKLNNTLWSRSNEDDIALYPVSKEYIETLTLPLKQGEFDVNKHSNENVVFITDELSNTYQVGHTYDIALNLEDDLEDKTISVYIGGILDKNWLFLPQEGELNFIRQYEDTMIVYLGENPEVAESQEEDSTLFTSYLIRVKAMDHANELKQQITSIGGVVDVKTIEEMKKSFDKYRISEMKIPVIMGVVITILCISTFGGYALMTVKKREKQYSIYYLCGANWIDCVIIQVLEAILLIAGSSVGAVFIARIYEGYFRKTTISTQGQIYAIIFCAIIIGVVPMVSMWRIKKTEPIEIIRREL